MKKRKYFIICRRQNGEIFPHLVKGRVEEYKGIPIGYHKIKNDIDTVWVATELYTGSCICKRLRLKWSRKAVHEKAEEILKGARMSALQVSTKLIKSAYRETGIKPPYKEVE